jgi:uncharacterized repeat protein (TIGR03803 family)
MSCSCLEDKVKRLALSFLLLFTTLAYAGERVLYSFQGGTDGFRPDGPLVLDPAGNLYGTTVYGGADGWGTVFELSPNGQGGWSETILYSFTGGADGQQPATALTLDSHGNLFGTTPGPGSCSPYCGSAFELSPGGSGWTFILLHAFRGEKDGGEVAGGLTMDSAGDLYGTTLSGGSKGYGTVFRLTNSGSGWKLKTLHAFGYNADGAGPKGTLVLASNTMIYGITGWGGLENAGVFYSLSLNGKGKWKEKMLYSFKGVRNQPQMTGLTADKKGRPYGVIDTGNRHVFRFARNQNGKWTKKDIYTFRGGGNGSPSGNVLIDQAGNVYGLASGGGGKSEGSLYKLTPQPDGKFVATQLYSFRGGSDGSVPFGPPIMDNAGNLYGVTLTGGGQGCGGNGCGTVFGFEP